jgi:steroid delta-isomerase-like uncharacterized protein
MLTNAEVVHRWFEEVWNHRDLAIVDELLSENSISHGLMDVEGNVRRGPAGFRMLFDAFTNAYPDMHVAIDKTVSEGDYVVVHVMVTGTHLGEGIGVAPTHRHVRFTGFCLIRVENGKIVEAWNQYDFMTMYQQLGVLSLTLG